MLLTLLQSQAVISPVAFYSGGFEQYASFRKRTKVELRLERERLGILPKAVELVIQKVAARKVLDPSLKLDAALHRALDQKHLAFRAYYAEVLRQELARIKNQEDEEVVLLLLM